MPAMAAKTASITPTAIPAFAPELKPFEEAAFAFAEEVVPALAVATLEEAIDEDTDVAVLLDVVEEDGDSVRLK